MNKESKEEACSILAKEYEEIAKASGIENDHVYKHYMERCMSREDITVAEQTVRTIKRDEYKDPAVSWVAAWKEQRLIRANLVKDNVRSYKQVKSFI